MKGLAWSDFYGGVRDCYGGAVAFGLGVSGKSVAGYPKYLIAAACIVFVEIGFGWA